MCLQPVHAHRLVNGTAQRLPEKGLTLLSDSKVTDAELDRLFGAMRSGRVMSRFVATAQCLWPLPVQAAEAVREVRPGRHGKPFTLIKFRTMLDVGCERGPVGDADLTTRLGAGCAAPTWAGCRRRRTSSAAT